MTRSHDPYRSRSGRSGSDRPRSASGRSRSLQRADVREPARETPLATVFDGIAEALVCAVLVFSPLAFGVRAAWSREVFLLLVAAAATVVTAKHALLAWSGSPAGFRWSWAYAVMLGFILLVAAQLVPLPAGWVRAVSPGTLSLKSELLADLPDSAGLLRRTTVSFNPHATATQLLLIVALAALYIVVLDVCRTPERIRRVLSVIAGTGLLMAGIAAYQNLTGWRLPFEFAKGWQPDSGLLSNHNLFSQYMNLSVGAALALVLDRVAELSSYYRSPGEIWRALGQPRQAWFWAMAALCVAGPLVVMLSLSRMGIVSLAVALAVSGLLLAWRSRAAASGHGQAWLFVGVGLAVFIALLYVGFDLVARRMSTLNDLDRAGQGRQEILQGMVNEFRQFPAVGTGLGTHEFVFGLYDIRRMPTTATHAENDYAQLMEETGVAGVALAALFLVGVAVSYARVVRRPTLPIDQVAFGLGFGLIAILIHSASDFGQHFPAAAAITATYAALLASLARRTARDEPPAVDVPRVRVLPGIAFSGVTLATVAAAVAVGLWAERARAAEANWEFAQTLAAPIERNGWSATPAELADLLRPAGAAIALDPGNVERQYWYGLYRFLAVPSGPDPKTGVDTVAPENMPAVHQIVADMDAARVRCPTYGLPLSILGQINRDTLGKADLGSHQIRLAYRLMPFNPDVCLIAGCDALNRHRWDEADAIFGQYAGLGGPVAGYVDPCLHADPPQPQIAYHHAEDDRGGLLYLASRMPQDDPKWTTWIERCRARASKLLTDAAMRPDALPADSAGLAAQRADQKQYAEAVTLYRKALVGEYGNVGWREQLAQCLAAQGQFKAAADEAKVILQLHPERVEFKTFIHECETRAATRPTTAPAAG